MFTFKSAYFQTKESDYPLARFYHFDNELRKIHRELDSFDGRKEQERCQKLIEKLRRYQSHVMSVLWVIVRAAVPEETRACRQYREKFPEELAGDHMSGPLWFGAECLAAGSSVLNREDQSDELRPHARHINKVMETVRSKLRKQCLRDVSTYPEELVDTLRWFDYNWAEFEFSYVSRMCTVITPEQLYNQHLVTVLFSETTELAIKENLITEDQMMSYDPQLMLAIPRLSILRGLQQSDGILDLNTEISKLPEYFRPHVTILKDVKKLLQGLTPENVYSLKRCLTASIDPKEEDTAPDILHCLYLTISSIADKMISNHAKDLRLMLQSTFKMNQPPHIITKGDVITSSSKHDDLGITSMDCLEPGSSSHVAAPSAHRTPSEQRCTNDSRLSNRLREEAPVWVPDCEASQCTLCNDTFTIIKRKHHCRYCGKIFCYSCTTNSGVLPFTKSPVRMCDTCYDHYTSISQQEGSSRTS